MSFRFLPASLASKVLRFQFKYPSRMRKLPFTVSSIPVSGTNLSQNSRFFSLSSNEKIKEEESREVEIKKEPKEMIKFTFVTHQGEHVEVEGECGQSLKTVAENYDSLMEGACEGVLACTTCHVYVPDDFADVFGEPCKKEEDLLDTAAFLKPESRLSCQLIVSKDIEGAQFKLPKGTVNMQVDGFKPKKH